MTGLANPISPQRPGGGAPQAASLAHKTRLCLCPAIGGTKNIVFLFVPFRVLQDFKHLPVA
jgi:hypothetical protein